MFMSLGMWGWLSRYSPLLLRTKNSPKIRLRGEKRQFRFIPAQKSWVSLDRVLKFLEMIASCNYREG